MFWKLILFEMLLLVMYIFVSVNLKPPDPLPIPTGEEVLPEKLGGYFRKPLPYLRAKLIFFATIFPTLLTPWPNIWYPM